MLQLWSLLAKQEACREAFNRWGSGAFPRVSGGQLRTLLDLSVFIGTRKLVLGGKFHICINSGLLLTYLPTQGILWKYHNFLVPSHMDYSWLLFKSPKWLIFTPKCSQKWGCIPHPLVHATSDNFWFLLHLLRLPHIRVYVISSACNLRKKSLLIIPTDHLLVVGQISLCLISTYFKCLWKDSSLIN